MYTTCASMCACVCVCTHAFVCVCVCGGDAVSVHVHSTALPMEYNLLPVGGLNDMAICVCKIILQLRNVRRVKLFLATQMLTVSQIASTMTSVLREKRFFDPEV